MGAVKLIRKVLKYSPNADVDLIKKAYNFSKEHLSDKKRRNNTEFDHAYNVALELTNLKADDITIAAGLLHDVIEKSDVTKENFRKVFNDEVYFLVDAVTRVSDINLPKGEYNIASFRKILISAAKDVRVIFIRLCEKLDSLRGLGFVEEFKQKEIAKNVLELYGPLAARLGLIRVKNELEDLAFRFYLPEEYKKVVIGLKETEQERQKRTRRMIKGLKEILDQNEIKAEVYGRVKHLYGIYLKIKNKDYDIRKMFDLVALRAIVSDVDDCYKVLRLVREKWRAIPTRFKDYIAYPKPNGYQSIHVGLIDDTKKPIEIQIRTSEMHRIAEEGIAAHFGYKGLGHGEQFEKKLGWLKNILESQKEVEDKEFFKSLKIDFFSEIIYVFTPKNEIVELPKGSTIVDFAYAVHSRVGDRCFGANVNDRFVSIRQELNNGDVVDILVSNNAKPSREWLKFVRTTKAKNYIKKYLKAHGEKTINVRYTKEEVRRELGDCLIGCDLGKGYDVKLAICCKPLPGDSIVGYKVGANSVRVHKVDCKTKKSKKAVKVYWREKLDTDIELKVEGKDRLGLLAEILNFIALRKFSVRNAKAKVISSDLARCSFIVHVKDVDSLVKLINGIEKLKGITRVYIGEISS